MRPVVLASGSRYRRELLARVLPAFTAEAPELDESRRPGESPRQLVERLARAKADAVAARHPHALVIGSDQTAALDDDTLGKPGTEVAACAQLARLSGREVTFYTALAVHDAASGRTVEACDTTRVRFRMLAAAEIAAYVARERPLDCAGSFKSEGLGIALFERIESSDPTALIGLPLIALCQALRTLGLDPVAHSGA